MARRITIHLERPLCDCRTETGSPPFTWSMGASGITVSCPECKIQISYPREGLTGGIDYSHWSRSEEQAAHEAKKQKDTTAARKKIILLDPPKKSDPSGEPPETR